MIGQTLDGKYLVVRLLGEGGMGAVYEARHTGTGRRVAVKVITGDLGKNASLVTRFQREARAAGAIDTQHIAQVLDTGTDPATLAPYMVIELLAGEDLQQLLRRAGPLDPDLALRIALQTCIGLGKAHDARVVHRDVKPANIFLAERDADEVVVKILDFGIAKIKHDEEFTASSAGLTRTGSMLGSPLYMSPEQARGQKTIDHRADLWSLGIVLYQALTGGTPFDNIEALGELVIAICGEAPRSVQESAPWVPPEVAAVVERALRVDPADRYQSAGEMHGALKALLPNGHGLHKAMLQPMAMEAKAVVARKLEIAAPDPLPARSSPARGASNPSHPPPARAASSPSHPPPAREGSSPSNPSLESATSPRAVGAATNEGVSREPDAPSRRSSLGPVIAASATLAIVGGFGVYKLARSGPATPAQVDVAAAIVAPAAPPVAPPAVTSTRAPAPLPSQDKTVRVALTPADASAEVDGVSVPSKDGFIEIVGVLGSVHRVRVFKGKLETSDEVVVTEAGAIPAKLEIAAASGKGKPAAPTAATSTVKPTASSGKSE